LPGMRAQYHLIKIHGPVVWCALERWGEPSGRGRKPMIPQYPKSKAAITPMITFQFAFSAMMAAKKKARPMR